MEVDAVRLPEVRGRLHAGKNHANTACLGAFDDRRQIALQLGDRQTAQGVVPPECDDEDPHVAFERPIEAAQPARRGIARYPGVDDLERQSFGVEPFLEQGRIRFVGRESEAGRKAVAEKHHAWARVDDFFGSGARDRHYVLDRTTGEIRFGDGTHGAIPVGNGDLPGSNVVAREYRFGGGTRGNVGPGKISTLLTSIEGIDEGAVGNLLAASGGRQEETLDEAKLRVPRAIRSRCRAVTNEDFEQLAIQAANIKRAKALPLTHPEFPGVKIPGVVTVIVVPDGDAPNPMPSEGTLKSVCAYLNQARLLTTELYVVPPRYQKVKVTATVVAEDEADLAEVKRTIVTALTDYFHPLRGGEQGQGWPFGGDIFYSRVYGRASVPGVQRIERLLIALDGTSAPECSNLPVCDGVLLYSDGHDVTVTYDLVS